MLRQCVPPSLPPSLANRRSSLWGHFCLPPQSLLALASATPRHRHCTSTSALSPRLLSNPYIPLQTRQLDALQSYLTFVQQFNEGLYGSDLAAAGAQTSTRSISRTGNRSGWCCYSIRCRGKEGLNGKDSFSQTQLEKPITSRRCSSCITEKFELIDPSVPLSGADASTSRGQQTTISLRPESLGLGPQVAPLSVAAGDGEALPPEGGKWPPWRRHNPDNSLLHPTPANLKTTLINYHEVFKGHIVADIMRRSPGRTISSDGTFRLMSRTTGSAKVLVLLLGADHSIIAYYVLKSEKWAELRPGLLRLRRRLDRLQTLSTLEEWWSDRHAVYSVISTALPLSQAKALRHATQMTKIRSFRSDCDLIAWLYNHIGIHDLEYLALLLQVLR